MHQQSRQHSNNQQPSQHRNNQPMSTIATGQHSESEKQTKGEHFKPNQAKPEQAQPNPSKPSQARAANRANKEERRATRGRSEDGNRRQQLRRQGGTLVRSGAEIWVKSSTTKLNDSEKATVEWWDAERERQREGQRPDLMLPSQTTARVWGWRGLRRREETTNSRRKAKKGADGIQPKPPTDLASLVPAGARQPPLQIRRCTTRGIRDCELRGLQFFIVGDEWLAGA